MTDKQMLQKIAKHIGHPFKVFYTGSVVRLYGRFASEWVHWNPLEDDAEAFRLMIDLGITVCPDGTQTVSACDASSKYGVFITENVGEQKDASVRRAIVRAAAAIAESSRDAQ